MTDITIKSQLNDSLEGKIYFRIDEIALPPLADRDPNKRYLDSNTNKIWCFEDGVWKNFKVYEGYRMHNMGTGTQIFNGTEWVASSAIVPPSVSAAPIETIVPPNSNVIYKSDVIRRMTEQEAEVFYAGLQTQPVKLRMLWDNVLYLDPTDEFFVDLKTGMEAAFGKVRAAEILGA